MGEIRTDKKRSRKRRSEQLSRHWLGEGSFGQDGLLDEFDPYLYAIDQKLCHRLSQLSYRDTTKAAKAQALMVVGEDSIPWHLAFLSEKFHLWIWGQKKDDLLDAATENFDAQVIYEELPDQVQGACSAIFISETQWSSLRELRQSLRSLAPLLSIDGEILTVMRAKGEAIEWADGTQTPLGDLSNAKLFGIPQPSMVETEAFKTIGDKFDFGISPFLKRHRAFFGEEARDLCLARMRDRDFLSMIREQETVQRVAILLGWQNF